MKNHLIVAAAVVVAALLIKYLPARKIIKSIPKIIYVTNLLETPIDRITIVTQTITKVVAAPQPITPLSAADKTIIPEGVEIKKSSTGLYKWSVNGWDSWGEFNTLADYVNNWRERNRQDIERAKITWEKVN